MKYSDFMNNSSQTSHSYSEAMRKDHESKPIRAGVASILSTPGYIAQLGGLASAGLSKLNPFNDKTFAENLQDSTLFNAGSGWVNKTHDIIGANRPEDQDKSEQVAGFVGDMIPTIATLGTYGAVKVPATIASKASNALGRKTITKKAKQKLQTLAQQGLDDAGLDKTARLEALKQAKIKTKDTYYHPLLATRDIMLPGIQIPRTNLLVKTNRIKGMSADEALKAARKAQLLSGGIQVGANIGAYEGLAALADGEGLIGDYRDAPESFELEQQINKEESNRIIPALVLGLGGYFGFKKAAKLAKSSPEEVRIINNRLNTDAQERQQWSPNTQVNDTVASSFSDKTTIMDNPEFNYLFPDEDIKGFVRADRQTEIQKMYDTGDVGHGIENTIPFRQIEQDLSTLQQQSPEVYDQIEKLLSLDNEIQSIIHDQNIKLHTKVDTPNNYSLFDLNTSYLSGDNILPSLKELYNQRKELYNSLTQNPQIKQVLDNISQTDKVLLQLQHKAGMLNKAEYDYNYQNRTIDGMFSYKPRIAASTDEGLLKNTLNKIKNYLFDKEYSTQLRGALGLSRSDYQPNLQTLSYLDTYTSKVRSILHDVTENSIKRTVLPRILTTQEKALFKRFEDLVPLRLKMFGKDPKKALDVLVDEADKTTRVKYLGSRDVRVNSQTQAPLDVFNYLNKPRDPNANTPFKYQYFTKQGKYKDAGNITSLIERKGSKENNTKVVSFFTEDGREHFFEVHKLIGNMLDFAPETLSFMSNVFRSSKRMMQSFTTGNLNPLFAPVSAIYAAFEGLTALPVILAKNGLEYNMLKDSYGLIRANIKSAKMRYTNQTTQNIIDNWRKAWLLNDVDNPILKKFNEEQIAVMERELKNTFLSKAQRAGAVTFHYSNDLSDRTFNLNINKTFSEQFLSGVQKRFGTKSAQVTKMLGVIQECLRNAGNDGMLLYVAGKQNVQDVIGLRKIADSISKNITDSKRVGNYSGFFGAFIGGIARYVPYGNVMIQSISAKLHAMDAKAGYDFIKTATKQIKKSDRKVADIFAQLQLGGQAIKDNKFVHGLVATAGIPAVICYLWNHSTDGQRENYYKLSDYDKSSKYILTNFWGEGRHLSIPVDQEVSVVAKLVETMLDSVLQGSKMQDTDPAFEQHKLIMQALSRSFNLENLVYPEAILNISGYQTNFGPSNISGTSLVSPLPPNQTNLDGSKTALQNGVFSQETRALVNTIFGALGGAIVGGVEQANIGTRDVGMLQGAADFASGLTRPLTKNLPLIPMENRFTLRSSNQTQQQNKLKQDTIQSLRKLRTFVENNNNSEFGRRKNGKVTNMAATQPLSPKLQYALQIANVAVPAYNERIAPIFDQISAVYKQVAAFNATGRDRFGNIVDAGDRFTFQQRRNEQIQKLHARIHEEFLSLEQQLTNTFGRDITLNDFDNLKGN